MTDFYFRIEHGGGITWQVILYELAIERALPFVGERPLLVFVGGPTIAIYCALYRLAKADQRAESRAAVARTQTAPDRDHQQRMPECPAAQEEVDAQQVFRTLPPRDQLYIPAGFTGRTSECVWLAQRLQGRTSRVAVWGLPGIGKKVLVHAVVQHLAAHEGRFRDGIVVVDCKAATDAVAVVRQILARFAPDDPALITEDPVVLQHLGERVLNGTDAVVLLHDVPIEVNLANLLPPLTSARGISVVITLTHQPPRMVIPAEHVLTLSVLEPERAAELFTATYARPARSGAIAPPLDPEVVRDIVELVGYHPLAIRLVAGTAADERRDLVDFAAELRRDPWIVTYLADGLTPHSTRVDFSRSTASLREDARTLFAGLAALRTGDFSRQAVVALARGLNVKPDAALGSLIKRQLLEPYYYDRMPPEGDRERFRCHPLVRAAAQAEFSQWRTKHDSRCQEALLALAHYYAHYVTTVGDASAIAPDEENILGVLDDAMPYVSERVEWWMLETSMCAGMISRWCASAPLQASAHYLRPIVLAAAKWARTEPVSREVRQHAATVLYVAGHVFARLGALADAVDANERALALAADVRDAHLIALLYRAQAEILFRRHDANDTGNRDDKRLFQAHAHLLEAEQQAQHHNDRLAVAAVKIQQAHFWRTQKHWMNAAVACDEAAATLDRQADYQCQPLLAIEHRHLRGELAYERAVIARERSRLAEASQYSLQAVEDFRRCDDVFEVARALILTGSLACQREQYAEGRTHFERAAAYAELVGAEALVTDARNVVRLMDWLLSEPTATAEAAGAAKVLRLYHLRGTSAPMVHAGLVAHQGGDLATAEVAYREALACAAAEQDHLAMGLILYNLSRVKRAQRFYVTAEALRHESDGYLRAADSLRDTAVGKNRQRSEDTDEPALVVATEGT